MLLDQVSEIGFEPKKKNGTNSLECETFYEQTQIRSNILSLFVLFSGQIRKMNLSH